MQAFTVHLPPPAAAQAPILVPERFAPWALLFGPLWLMRHGVWWWGLAGLALVILAPWPVVVAVHLLCGLCARDARRAALTRRGWRLETVVVAENADAAIRRLLDARPGLSGLFLA
jgi:hypothetical protein